MRRHGLLIVLAAALLVAAGAAAGPADTGAAPQDEATVQVFELPDAEVDMEVEPSLMQLTVPEVLECTPLPQVELGTRAVRCDPICDPGCLGRGGLPVSGGICICC